MSLILDALKRAERERRLGQAPDALDELPSSPPPPPEKTGRRRWFAAAAALTIVALALLAFWRSGRTPSTPPSEVAAAAVPTPAPTAAEAANADEEPAAVDPVVSARIEDESAIASLDDLTGDDGSTDDAAAGEDPESDPEVDVAAPKTPTAQPVPPGPTLYTPTKRAPPAPIVAPSPAPLALTAAAPPPRPAPAPLPPPAPVTMTSQIVLEPAPRKPYAQPPGPIVRFGADGSNEVIPVAPSTPEPVAPPPPAPLPAEAPEPAAVAAAAPATAAPLTTPVPSPAELPVLVEPAKPLYVEPTAVDAAPPPPLAPVPASRPAARRPPPAPPPSTIGLPRLRDMPAPYRADFPALSVDVHVYNADPARRFVLVNGRRYGEANALSEGPQIVEIVPDGMILDWRNERIFYTLGR